jgi:hypothetical protein
MSETSTITALNTLIQRQFSKDVMTTLDQSAIMLNWMKEVDAQKINSQSKAFPVLTDRGGSIKGASEYDDFPEAVPPQYDQWLPSLRYVLSTGSFSHRALIQNGISGVDGMKSLVGIGKELGQRINDEYESWLKRLSAACYRDGKAKISSAISAVTTGASGTFTIDPATADYFVDLFSEGLPIEFRTSGGTIHNQSGADPVSIVSAVNRDTGVVTCDNIPTDAAIGDFPVYSGSWDLFPHGFEYNIQNQDTTINGLNVTGLSQLKSLVQSRSGRAFSIKDVNLANIRAMRFAGVNNKLNDYAFFMNPTLYNSALNEAYDMTTINRNSTGGGKVDLLFESYEIGGNRVYLDNDAPRRQLIALKKSTWRWFYAMKPGLVKAGSGEDYLFMQNAVSGVGHRTGYNYYMAADYDIVTLNPAANYRLTDYDISDTYF